MKYVDDISSKLDSGLDQPQQPQQQHQQRSLSPTKNSELKHKPTDENISFEASIQQLNLHIQQLNESKQGTKISKYLLSLFLSSNLLT